MKRTRPLDWFDGVWMTFHVIVMAVSVWALAVSIQDGLIGYVVVYVLMLAYFTYHLIRELVSWTHVIQNRRKGDG